MQYRMLLLILGALPGESVVADSKGPHAASLTEVQRAKDATVFVMFDTDKSGFLEPHEMENVIAKAGINPSTFDWHNFDTDKDGRISQEEFVMAGPAALAATFPRDQRIFQSGDVDHTGFLEENEINSVLSHAGIEPESFNWLAFDHDGDHRLSEEEFIESGPAAAEAARRQNAPNRVFKALDADATGILNAHEIGAFMQDMNIQPEHWNWRLFDTDSDGGLSEKEFIAAGPAIADASMVQERPRQIFHQADHDGSSFLEPVEVTQLMQRSGLHPAHFNWHAFDQDGDGRLNFAEFLAAAPAAASATPQVPTAVQQEQQLKHAPAKEVPTSMQQEQQLKPASAEEVFKGSDRDASGFLEAKEMEHLLQMAGIAAPTFNWRAFDHDGDGKLNLSEFYQADRAVTNMPPPPAAELNSQAEAAEQHGQFDAETKEIFEETDADGSKFLEPGEVEEFLSHLVPLPKSRYDWRSFDRDRDGRLSYPEFRNAGPAALQQQGLKDGDTDAAAFLETHEEDEDDEDHEEDDEDDESESSAFIETDALPEDGEEAVFDGDGAAPEYDAKPSKHHVDSADDLVVLNMTDVNKDGFCNATEMAHLQNISGMKGVDWKNYDFDEDGKLSKREFISWSQHAKDHASEAFKRRVMVLTGEMDAQGNLIKKPSSEKAETLPADDEVKPNEQNVTPPLKAESASVTVAANGHSTKDSEKTLMRAAAQRSAHTKDEGLVHAATQAQADAQAAAKIHAAEADDVASSDDGFKKAAEELKKLANAPVTAGKVDADESALQVSSESPMMRTAHRHLQK